eukprot:CAMPEP_0202445252 /NCGR_PEP_ID=MMETSP1360-20130828/4106_1 /ASSEMBLY_ACC=CAM_ASM_000848 /TAXON_ID=515479 /ORGANISM="Licmophora paradoxa, Strain CCMP2313" /LENGTH=135 /DNA_ID=CAMNT_0049061439 /DNA_START=38 /DNA_END=442 /DNA_ORIENTATION=+
MPALENRSSALLEGDAMGNFAKSEKNHDVSEMTAHSSTYTTEERTARGTRLMDELNNDGIVEEQNPSVNYVHHDSGHGFDFTKTEIKALKKFVLHILSRSHGNGIIDSEDSEEKRRLISNDVDEEQSTVNMMDDI